MSNWLTSPPARWLSQRGSAGGGQKPEDGGGKRKKDEPTCDPSRAHCLRKIRQVRRSQPIHFVFIHVVFLVIVIYHRRRLLPSSSAPSLPARRPCPMPA